MMRGKRPRPLLPCVNKPPFVSNMGAANAGYGLAHLDPTSAIFTESTTISFPVSSKAPVSPSVPHRVVVGFELVGASSENKPSELCESPRSVLDRNVLKSSVFRSPLGSLLSSCQESDLMIASTVCPSVGVKENDHGGLQSQDAANQQEIRMRTVQESSSEFKNTHLNVEVSNVALNGHGAVMHVVQNQQEFRTQTVPKWSSNHLQGDVSNIDIHDHLTVMKDEKGESIFFTGSPPMVCCSRKQTLEFLKHCCFCDSHLEGKDVFMYRGDQAFCSAECRYQKIVIDEHTERETMKVAAHFNLAAAINCHRF